MLFAIQFIMRVEGVWYFIDRLHYNEGSGRSWAPPNKMHPENLDILANGAN